MIPASKIKTIETVEIHMLRDLLIPKTRKSQDGFGHYLNNSARRLLLDTLSAAHAKRIFSIEDVKIIVSRSSPQQLVELINKSKSQFSKMVGKGEQKMAEFVCAVLVSHLH